MTKTKPTVSLEIAKTLREAGWEQGTTKFGYCIDSCTCKSEDVIDAEFERNLAKEGIITNHPVDADAPMLHELLDAMPIGTVLYKSNDTYKSFVEEHKWIFGDPNPVNAAALLWIRLRERGIV